MMGPLRFWACSLGLLVISCSKVDPRFCNEVDTEPDQVVVLVADSDPVFVNALAGELEAGVVGTSSPLCLTLSSPEKPVSPREDGVVNAYRLEEVQELLVVHRFKVWPEDQPNMFSGGVADAFWPNRIRLPKKAGLAAKWIMANHIHLSDPELAVDYLSEMEPDVLEYLELAGSTRGLPLRERVEEDITACAFFMLKAQSELWAGRPGEGMEDVRLALEHLPNQPAALFILGLTHFFSGDKPRSQKYMSLSIKHAKLQAIDSENVTSQQSMTFTANVGLFELTALTLNSIDPKDFPVEKLLERIN